MKNSKNAKFLILLAGVIFQISTNAFATPVTDLGREKAVVEKLLEQKFSYHGNINGSYGFLDKLIDLEDIEAHKDLASILRNITYPKSLSKYTSLYIGTDILSNSVRGDDKDKSIIITGKKIDAIELIKFLSSNPSEEISLQSLTKKKLAQSSDTLKDYMSSDLLETLLTVVDLKCVSDIKSIEQFSQKLLEKDFQKLPSLDIDVNSLPSAQRDQYSEAYKIAAEKEKSILRFQNFSVNGISLYFNQNKIEANLTSRSSEQTVVFNLSEQCEIQNLMVRTFSNGAVKKILHFDKDLKITKKVFNNQERIFSKASKTNATPVATLDSGLDYNHPSVVENLLSPMLKPEEAMLYESSKKHFIKDLEFKEKFAQARSKVSLDLKYSKLNIEESQKNFTKKQIELAEKEKDLKEIAEKIQIETAKLNSAQAALKPLEVDKLLIFKPAKQVQIKNLKQQIKDSSSAINSLIYNQEYKSKTLKLSQSEKARTEQLLIEVKKTNDSYMENMSKLESEEAEHLKMLDIFTRGVTAWNFYDDNDTPSDFWDGESSILYTSYDHGTHVTGIILNGSEGELAIFPMRYPKQLEIDRDETKEKKVYQAIELAYKKGVRVINISMGTFAPESSNAEDKIKNDRMARYSWRSLALAAKDFPDMLFVCASGNDGANTDERGHYPSSFENSNIMSIAAVDSKNVLAKFSNYGKKTVDFAAPGVGIVSLVPNGGMGIKSGTSMATPFATRVAGRIEHINPALTPEQIKDIIGTTVIKTNELLGKTLYGGAIDEKRALRKACETITLDKRLLMAACK